MLETPQVPNKSCVQPTSIEAPSGKLFAIEHHPDTTPEICIIMLNSGMLNRCGPQRLYWAFANEACERGMAVLRADLAGVGDSQAEIGETHFDNHKKEDVKALINYAQQQWPQAKIILQGLCAGSRVSFKAACDTPAVAGLLAWSTEIFTASQNMPQSPLEPEDRLSEYEVSSTLSRLIQFIVTMKFLKPSWWRAEYPGGKGFVDDILHTSKCLIKAALPKGKPQIGEFLVSADSYLAQDRKVLFAFGEHDERALSEFRSRFSQVQEGELLAQGYTVIEQGTHTYSTLHSQEILFEHSLQWVESHF